MGELLESAVVSILETTAADGKTAHASGLRCKLMALISESFEKWGG